MSKILYYKKDDSETTIDISLENTIKRILKDHNLILKNINIIERSDEDLLKINQQHLNHNYFTDIITFELSENPKEVDAELYVSIDRVIDNSIIEETNPKTELYRVIIHGVLHLVGYKDSLPKDKKEMTKMENKYLSMIL